MWQDRILSQLLSPLTLSRLHDSELKVAADADALTTAELLERLTKAIYSEVDTVKTGEFTNRKPAISSLRRNLQRAYLRRMSQLALGQTAAPEDCQTVAFAELGTAEDADRHACSPARSKLDSYSRAHLRGNLGADRQGGRRADAGVAVTASSIACRLLLATFSRCIIRSVRLSP